MVQGLPISIELLEKLRFCLLQDGNFLSVVEILAPILLCSRGISPSSEIIHATMLDYVSIKTTNKDIIDYFLTIQ
jgi:hypothetical protein